MNNYNFEYIPTNGDRHIAPTPEQFGVTPAATGELTPDQAGALSSAAWAEARSIYDPELAVAGIEQRVRPLTPEQISAAKVADARKAGASVLQLRRDQLDLAA